MADKKISELDSATTPLGGDSLVVIVQGGVTKKTTYSELAEGQFVSKYSQGIVTIADSGELELPIVDDRNKYAVAGASAVRGFELIETGEVWNGKPFFVSNDSDENNLNLYHDADGVIPMIFPSETAMHLPPRSTAQFYYKVETGQMIYVGVEFGTGGGGAVDSVNGQTGDVVLDSGDVGAEPSANKQDSLAVDGTGTKFPTVDAVNAGLKKTLTINMGIAGTIAANTSWLAPTREANNLFSLTSVADSYTNASRTIGEARAAGYVIPFDCRIKAIRWHSGTLGNPLQINIHNWVATGSISSSNQTLGSKTMPTGSGGEVFEYTGSEIDLVSVLPKNSRLAPIIFNNNLATGAVRWNLFVIELVEI